MKEEEHAVLWQQSGNVMELSIHICNNRSFVFKGTALRRPTFHPTFDSAARVVSLLTYYHRRIS